MLDSLPREICFDIFTRLPTKTLIRCTTLSKKYQSLIINPEFTHAHIRRNTTNNKSRFFLRASYGQNDERFFFEPRLDVEPLSGFPSLSQLDDDHNESWESLGVQVPINSSNEWFSILGSINGVICLSDDDISYTDVYILWNPSIKKWLELPSPLITFPTHGPYYLASGFGFDSFRNDYKVVRIVLLDNLPGPFKEPPLVEVYSVNSGCWKIVGVGPSYYIRDTGDVWTPCFLDGAVHWLGKGIGPAKGDYAIVTFNVCLEVCGIIELPECLRVGDVIPHRPRTFKGEEANTIKNDILEYKGMLAVIKKESKPRTCCIWVMKEYGVVESWTKMFHLDFSDDCSMPWSFGFTNNGEIIVTRLCDRNRRLVDKVVLLEPTKQIEKLVGGMIGNVYHVATYFESMALFAAGKRDG